MNRIETDDISCLGKGGSHILASQQDNYMSHLYELVDEMSRTELNRLYVQEGVVPACKPGCFQCCGQHIPINIVEAESLTNHIKKEFSQDQIEELRIRTRQWHEYDRMRPAELQKKLHDERIPAHTHQYCPMLVDGVCSAYAMRPVICRMHFVISDPTACRPFYDQGPRTDHPVKITSFDQASHQFLNILKDLVEDAGLNFCRSFMLLPHWLAIQMDWDFAIS